ncbi:MAG: hypothetical protein AAB873_03195 [Patescibacteria group bacterium]
MFSKSKDEKRLVLVFDIGSSSVGGMFFEARKDASPRIIQTIRESIKLEKEINPEKLLHLTTKTLESVAGKLSKVGAGIPTEIFCILSSAFYASQTRTIKFDKNTPFVFTSKLAETLGQKEVDLFKEENKSHKEKIRVFEYKNIKTLLNGYTTHAPLNKKAKSIEISMFISMALESVLHEIEEAISKSFHSKNIEFASFTMASFIVARDMFTHKEDFILIDITGEITEIAVVKKEALAGSVSYHVGTNFFIRKTSEFLAVSLEEAKSIFSLYKDGHAEVSLKRKLDPFMNGLVKEWLRKLEESLTVLGEGVSIPSDMFVTIDDHLQDFFLEIIKKESFNQHAFSSSKFRIFFLDTKTLHGFASFKGETKRDSFLVVESIYLNRFVC